MSIEATLKQRIQYLPFTIIFGCPEGSTVKWFYLIREGELEPFKNYVAKGGPVQIENAITALLAGWNAGIVHNAIFKQEYMVKP